MDVRRPRSPQVETSTLLPQTPAAVPEAIPEAACIPLTVPQPPSEMTAEVTPAVMVEAEATPVDPPVEHIAPHAPPVGEVGAATPSLDAVSQAIAASKLPSTLPPENKVEPLSVRERAALREQKRQGSKSSNNWLTSHGKLLAIGFVIALAGTIFLARASRKPAPVTGPEIEWPTTNPGAAANLAADATEPTAVVAASLPAAKAASPSEASPATIAENPTPPAASEPPAQPRVDLLAPTIPSTPETSVSPAAVASDAPSQETKTAENLFPWKNTPEERVAARPETPAASPPPAPPVQQPPAAAPPAAPVAAPVAAPAASAPPQYQYPQTNYQGLSQPLPGPAAPPSGVPANGNATGPSLYAPSNASAPAPPASGYRNEPHGSGLY